MVINWDKKVLLKGKTFLMNKMAEKELSKKSYLFIVKYQIFNEHLQYKGDMIDFFKKNIIRGGVDVFFYESCKKNIP